MTLYLNQQYRHGGTVARPHDYQIRSPISSTPQDTGASTSTEQVTETEDKDLFTLPDWDAWFNDSDSDSTDQLPNEFDSSDI